MPSVQPPLCPAFAGRHYQSAYPHWLRLAVGKPVHMQELKSWSAEGIDTEYKAPEAKAQTAVTLKSSIEQAIETVAAFLNTKAE
jgi:hypothetical protein